MKWLRFALCGAMVLAMATLTAQAQEKDKDKDKAKDTEKAKDTDKDKGKIGESPYYPLQVGTAWHYKLGDQKFTMKVTKHEPVGKVLCARVELIVDNKVTAFEHIGVTETGIYRYSYEGKNTEPPVLILKLPPKPGDTWEVSAKVGGETLKGMLKEGEEDVKVPAGSYKAVTVAADDFDANGTKMAFKYYFAKDVGMVKQDLDVNGQKAVIELEKFDAPKK